MHIAFFTDTYHPTIDGVVRSIDMLKSGLEKKGHKVSIYAPAPSINLGKEGKERLYLAPSLPFLPYKQYRVPICTSKLIKSLQNSNPDIIHSHAMVLMGLAARSGARKISKIRGKKIPLAGTFHTLLPQAAHYIMPIESFESFVAGMIWEYLRWFYQPFDQVFAPSAFLAKILQEHKIYAEIAPNPVDTSFFKPQKEDEQERAKKNGEKPKPRVIFVGRVAKEKNLDFLLEMALQKEWREWGAELAIIGDGPYRKNLEEKARRHNLQEIVRFYGRVPDSALVKIYNSACCIIQPSLFETQGLSVLEAMACGTPAIVRAKTALAEIVKKGEGGEWFEDDAKEAVEIARQVSEKRNKYSRRCRMIAEEYSIEKCTQKLIGFYEKLE